MKKFDNQQKINLYYIIVICIYLLSIHGLILINSRISSDENVEFFKDLIMMIFSGVFSASVAYIVSSVRVNQELKKQLEKDNNQNNRIKKLLLLEVQSNKETLEKLKNLGFNSKNKNVLESQLSFVIYKRYIDKIILDDESMITLIKMYRNITFYTTLKPEDMEIGYEKLLSSIDNAIENLK